MALRKQTISESAATPADGSERRDHGRSLETLIQQLRQGPPNERRWAARDLADYPAAATVLCERLPTETEPTVREAILDSLMTLGNAAVVEALLPLLRSEDTGLRNGVIEVLQNLPQAVAPKLRGLLADPDSDVRIFTIDILHSLPHPETPAWLSELIERETHVNVIGSAVDCLAEIGTPEMIPQLERLKTRFAEQPFIGFAVDAAIARISEH